jgi:hypothetical protein
MYKNKIGHISFSTENMEEFIKNCNSQKELLPLYLDKVRNGYIFTEEMLENIRNFDDKSKMKIIAEYNRCMVYFKLIVDK